MKKLLAKTCISSLPLCAASLCIYGIMYLAIQQYIRLSANEIPMQYAQDTKERLENGIPVIDAVKGMHVTNMQTTLSPFVIICNSNGVPLSGTSLLNGKFPAPPLGALEVAEKNGEDRISWQPTQSVRNAIVILPYTFNGNKGFVIAGRSLRETEMRKQFLFTQITFGLFVTMLVIYVASFMVQFITNRLLL